MKRNNFKTLTTLLGLILSTSIIAQYKPLPKAKTNAFWEHVKYGGGLGLGFGSDYTNVSIAPSAIYSFSEQFAFGAGLQYSYLNQKQLYTSNLYGGSLIGLFNPISEVQLSLEIEEVNVNNKYQAIGYSSSTNFWYTGLFIGAGYRNENVTIGARYNLLFDKNKDVYGEALMPFVRVYF